MSCVMDIPRKLRIFIIIELSMGLSALLWTLGYPFMGGYFTAKSELLLFESVIGIQDTLQEISKERALLNASKAKMQAKLFMQLDETTQKWVLKGFEERRKALSSPPLQKMREATEILLSLSFFEGAWLLLAIALPIALLLGKSWAPPWVWILPALTVGYIWTNARDGTTSFSDHALFPSEKALLAEEISQGDERKALEKAWQRYLIISFGNETPEADEEALKRQAIRGEFYFSLERLRHLPPSTHAPFSERKSPFTLLLYALWNLAFALAVHRAFISSRDGVFSSQIPPRQRT